MNVVSRRVLIHYWVRHPKVKWQLESWYKEVSSQAWTCPNDVIALNANARTIWNGRVVFNILDNAHRLIISVNYKSGRLFIKFIGTHTEYDKVDAVTVDKY